MIDEDTLAQVVHFHGHLCPGLALGIRAAEVALERIGPHAEDEEVVAIVETDMCGVDGIQFLTGCTFGKGNMLHLDHGKNAYTFVRRRDGRAIRISSRAGSFAPRAGGTDLDVSREERSRRILAAPLEDLYDVREVDAVVPPFARVFDSVGCAGCGEPTMETRIRRVGGVEYCPPCFEAAIATRSAPSAPVRSTMS